MFADRVANALSARKVAESIIRYNLYVDCMPTDDVGDLDAEQVNRIIKNSLEPKVLQDQDHDTSNLILIIDENIF